MALSLTRILLSLVFIATGYSKVFGYGGNSMQGWIDIVKTLRIPGTANTLPNAELLAQIAAYGELVGGILLLLGVLSRVTALGLLLFTIAASVLGHAFWMQADQVKMFEQLGYFLKNMGLVGGLLAIVAYGGGVISIDGMFRRPQ
jgi:putative oxidoreductase